MIEAGEIKQTGFNPSRVSYLFIVATLVLVGWLHLATPLLAALFSYLALTRLHWPKRGGKWLAVGLFLVLLAGAAYELGRFANHAVKALPEIADKAIPSIIEWARQHQIDLPFTDYDSLRDLALGTVTSQVNYLGRFANFARGATTQFVFLATGCVIAISVFLNPRLELGGQRPALNNNLYSLCCREIAARFSVLYHSFATVMGAQIIISAINTVFTTVFVLIIHLPYAAVVVGVTFLCGLVPVVGNLVSNTIIIGIGFTVSPRTALLALIFLVVIHKLEYFLNSKIIGYRIRNPLWLTLVALIIGERLMGIPGMILALVVLNYLRLEMSIITVQDTPGFHPSDLRPA
jgi:predicted PurR-regulated permease PerM